MFVFENLPITFLIPLMENLTSFELVNFLTAVECKNNPNEIFKTFLYKNIFNQK
jgi:hypothetical protein